MQCCFSRTRDIIQVQNMSNVQICMFIFLHPSPRLRVLKVADRLSKESWSWHGDKNYVGFTRMKLPYCNHLDMSILTFLSPSPSLSWGVSWRRPTARRDCELELWLAFANNFEISIQSPPLRVILARYTFFWNVVKYLFLECGTSCRTIVVHGLHTIVGVKVF